MKHISKNIENRNNPTTSNAFQPIYVYRGMYILKQFMNIYLNELQGKEPLDLSDVTIPWEKEEDIPDEDELFPLTELDAIALADNKAGKEFNGGVKTDPCDYIEAVVDKYYSGDSKALFVFFPWYNMAMKTILDKCKEAELPVPEPLKVSFFNPYMVEALGAEPCQSLPDNLKETAKQLPFKANSFYELTPETGTELIKHCLVHLYYLYNLYIHAYYVGARQHFAEEEKKGNAAA